MKVFSFYPYTGNLVNFKIRKDGNNTHHLYRYV